MLIVTKFTHNQQHYVQISNTEFHPYWENMKYRQKFIYVPKYTCQCTNFHKTHSNAIQFMDLSCTIFYPNQEKTIDNWSNISIVSVRRARLSLQSLSQNTQFQTSTTWKPSTLSFTRIAQDRQSVSTNSSSPLCKD